MSVINSQNSDAVSKSLRNKRKSGNLSGELVASANRDRQHSQRLIDGLLRCSRRSEP